MSSTIAQDIIDPSGEVWDVDQLAVEQAVSRVPIIAPVQTLIDDLVTSKGYVSLRTSERACQILINPHRVRRPALERLRAILREQSAALVILGCYGARWEFRLHVSKAQGLEYIAACAEAARPTRENNFLSRAMSEAALLATGRGPLRNALDLVQGSGGRFDVAWLPKLDQMTDRRFMVCRWHPNGRIWRIEHAGTGYYSSHIDVAQHRTVSNQPSFEYGCWIHDRYLETMHRDTPTLDEVDAFVTTPGVGPRRMQYRRLLVPITDAAGNPLLLSTSVRDATIDLGAGGTGPSLANAPLSRE